jgi:DNA end-binding protein Ku
MYYVNEVRQGEEHVTGGDVPAKELDLAKKFVEAIAAPFSPEEFTDRYREQLEALIASKETVASRAAEAPIPAAGVNVIDIMDALQKSLAKVRAEKDHARKPAGRAAGQQKPRKRRA